MHQVTHSVALLEGSCGSNTDTVSAIASEPIETSPVIHLVTDAKGNVLHEVHVQMQELPVVDAKSLDQDVSVISLKYPSRVLGQEVFRLRNKTLLGAGLKSVWWKQMVNELLFHLRTQKANPALTLPGSAAEWSVAARVQHAGGCVGFTATFGMMREVRGWFC